MAKYVHISFIIWNTICSNSLIFIVLTNISVHLKIMISLDVTAGIYKMKTNALDIGQSVSMDITFHSSIDVFSISF